MCMNYLSETPANLHKIIYFEAHAQPSAGIIVIEQFEAPYFGCVVYMLADAGASIVISYAYNPEHFACIFGKFTSVYNMCGFFARQEGDRNG